MNRRGFIGALVALLAIPGAAIAAMKKPKCDHALEKWTCDPKRGLEPPVMRCLCGKEIAIWHPQTKLVAEIEEDFWRQPENIARPYGISYWVKPKDRS